jgi:hypothetical protein
MSKFILQNNLQGKCLKILMQSTKQNKIQDNSISNDFIEYNAFLNCKLSLNTQNKPQIVHSIYTNIHNELFNILLRFQHNKILYKI